MQTSAVPSYAAHPLKRYLDFGLRASINSDDPAISGIDLRHEFEVAAPAAGLDLEHARRAQQCALEMAFLTQDARRELMRAKSRPPA